jgi:hypothetical protein
MSNPRYPPTHRFSFPVPVPPKPAPYGSSTNVDDLNQQMGALNVSNGSAPPSRPFAGGFGFVHTHSGSADKPLPSIPPPRRETSQPSPFTAFAFPTPSTASPISTFHPGPPPRPPGQMLSIPTPTPPYLHQHTHSDPSSPAMSLTYQYATSSATNLSTPPQAQGRPSPHLTPSFANRPRASSVPPSPSTSSSADVDKVQCSGITKADKRCARMVNNTCALAAFSPDEPVERYCHQHRGELLLQTGFYTLTEPSVWVKFDGIEPCLKEYLESRL